MNASAAEDIWDAVTAAAGRVEPAVIRTRVRKIVGLLIEAAPLKIPLGSRLVIRSRGDRRDVPVELVGFSPTGLFLMPFGRMDGIAPGDEVVYETSAQTVWLGEGLLGRVLSGEGRLIDDGPEVLRPEAWPIYREAPSALKRKPISESFLTGIKAWDGFLTMGRGQRMGIFAGTGVGKSILLGMIARNCNSDVNVLALVGERGHEVNDFIHNVMGEEGMKKSVLVVATSDQTPLVRLRAAYIGAALAEFFAAKGKNVLFLMDSITRMAMAARELGLSIGEPPTSKGYPPSVFAMMPRLLERSGSFGTGSITAIISVLIEGDDLLDPIGDAVRGVIDGHVVLSRNLSNRGQYPAIDVNESLSRWMSSVASDGHMSLARKARKILADWKDAEDLINVGAYVRGSNPDIDEAIARIGPLRALMAQGIRERVDFAQTLSMMKEVLS